MVAVLGHLDVVPLEGLILSASGGEIHDGVLYGRGVEDDKGPTDWRILRSESYSGTGDCRWGTKNPGDFWERMRKMVLPA